MPTDGLARFCCQNSECPCFGVRDVAILSSCGRVGKANHRLHYYVLCTSRCSQFRGTWLFHSKLPYDRLLTVQEHLADWCGVRQTSRRKVVNQERVNRIALLDGRYANATHGELVAFSLQDPRGPVRCEVNVPGQEADELRLGERTSRLHCPQSQE